MTVTYLYLMTPTAEPLKLMNCYLN